MNIVYVMFLSIFIKAISAVIEILIQICISNGVGLTGYGDYTFYVSLVEFVYYCLFSGSIKLNTFYLSDKTVNITNFKSKYLKMYVLSILAILVLIFISKKSYYGITACVIILLYYISYDYSSQFIARGHQIFALTGEYLVGRTTMLLGILCLFRFNLATGLSLFVLYGLQYLAIIVWLWFRKNLLPQDTRDVPVSKPKLLDFQKSDIALSVISYSPAILQYVFVGAFETGFVGIITVAKKIINFISGPTSKVFLPEFSRLYQENKKEKMISTYIMIVRVQMIFIGSIAVIMIGFPELILTIFSPELVAYKTFFTVTSFCLLLIASAGPVTGILQMTGNERICNRNQWISIIFMLVTWIIMKGNAMFTVYGLCVQAIVEVALKYYSICKWFKRNIIPVKLLLIMWLPILLLKIIIVLGNYSDSMALLLISMLVIGSINLFTTLLDPMVKSEIIKRIRQGR